MSDERKQSLFIIAYPEHNAANQVYKTLRGLEKQDKIDIKTAATVRRKDNGKLKLDHKRRVTVWKGAFGGGAIALVLTYLIAGPAALAANAAAVVAGSGAGVGALVGSSRSGERKDAKKFLEDKLDSNASALVILVSDADWTAVESEVGKFGGEELKVELTPEAEKEIGDLSKDDQVAEAVQKEVEVGETEETDDE